MVLLMEISQRHAVVTGGASGIGRALATRFAQEGARAVVVADYNLDGARQVAESIGGQAVRIDAGRENDIRALIAQATEANGPIDLYVSNAGVPGPMGGPEAPDEEWDLTWRVNVMAHVWAARALVPEMVRRGDGYLVNTASAAGLLTQVSALAYSATKSAAVAVAEWLAIRYGDAGVKVSCICPQAVRTPMLDLAMEEPAGAAALTAGGLLDPEDVAAAVVAGIREERFLILPHEEVARFMAVKGTDPERWLAGMRRIVRQATATEGARQ
jgi:NAD(P)-dependent dehydrogenase (short-subunit alcohol dehydrogenase family)